MTTAPSPRPAAPRTVTVALGALTPRAALPCVDPTCRGAGDTPSTPRLPHRCAPSASATRRQPGHPGRLHRLRLRPVPGPDPGHDGRLAGALAVPRRRHLHLRRLAGLPQPAEPDPPGCSTQLRKGLAAAADHARPAGVVPAALPALRRRLTIDPRPRSAGELQPGPQAGPRLEARSTVAVATALGHHRRQHALVRPRGLRRQQHRLPRVRAVVPQRLDRRASRPRATSRASTPAPAPASRCSTTPASTARTRSCCPTGSGWPAGTAWPTPPRPTCVRTAGARAAGSSSTGRPRRDLGRRDGSTSTRNYLDLGRGSVSRRRAALRRRRRVAARLPRTGPGDGHEDAVAHRRQGAAVPAHREGRLRRPDQRRSTPPARSAPPTPGRPSAACGAGDSWYGRHWMNLLSSGRTPVQKVGSAGALRTPRAARPQRLRHGSRRQGRDRRVRRRDRPAPSGPTRSGSACRSPAWSTPRPGRRCSAAGAEPGSARRRAGRRAGRPR